MNMCSIKQKPASDRSDAKRTNTSLHGANQDEDGSTLDATSSAKPSVLRRVSSDTDRINVGNGDNRMADLEDIQLIENCIDYLFLDEKTVAFRQTRETLRRGFEVLIHNSNHWPDSPVSEPSTLRNFVHMHVATLSKSDAMALYHVLNALAVSSSFLDVEYREHLFETSVFLWVLQLGPRGLVKVWEDGQTTVEALYEAEQASLLACRYDGACVAALVDLGKEFRSWGVRVRGLIDGDEDVLR